MALLILLLGRKHSTLVGERYANIRGEVKMLNFIAVVQDTDVQTRQHSGIFFAAVTNETFQHTLQVRQRKMGSYLSIPMVIAVAPILVTIRFFQACLMEALALAVTRL